MRNKYRKLFLSNNNKISDWLDYKLKGNLLVLYGIPLKHHQGIYKISIINDSNIKIMVFELENINEEVMMKRSIPNLRLKTNMTKETMSNNNFIKTQIFPKTLFKTI